MAFMGTSVHKTWYINTLDNYTIFVSRSCWPVKTGGLNSTLDISLSCNSLRICETAATLNDHLFQRDWALQGEITIEHVWCPCSSVSQNVWREKSQTVCRWVPCVETHIPNWFRMCFFGFSFKDQTVHVAISKYQHFLKMCNQSAVWQNTLQPLRYQETWNILLTRSLSVV